MIGFEEGVSGAGTPPTGFSNVSVWGNYIDDGEEK